MKIHIERYKWFCKDDIRVANFILEGSEYIIRTPQNKKQDIYDLIRKKIPAVEAPVWKIYENWNLKERQAKFIVNSAKVYTWFGYE